MLYLLHKTESSVFPSKFFIVKLNFIKFFLGTSIVFNSSNFKIEMNDLSKNVIYC